MERVNDPWLSTLTLTPSRRCGTDDCLVASRPSPSKRDRSSKGGRATERERLLGRAGPVGHRFQVGDPLPDLVASGFIVGIGLPDAQAVGALSLERVRVSAGGGRWRCGRLGDRGGRRG